MWCCLFVPFITVDRPWSGLFAPSVAYAGALTVAVVGWILTGRAICLATITIGGVAVLTLLFCLWWLVVDLRHGQDFDNFGFRFTVIVYALSGTCLALASIAIYGWIRFLVSRQRLSRFM